MGVQMLKILFLLFVFAFVNVYAQDNTDDTNENDKQEQQTDDTLNEQESTEQLSPDTFDATEKLSEDLSYDFPVDI